MKLKPTMFSKSNNIKPIYKIQRFFFNGKVKIKTLLKDVFEKNKEELSLGEPRELPNCIGAADELFSTSGGGYLKYYPEDLEKMRNMTKDECNNFIKQLRKEKRFYIEK